MRLYRIYTEKKNLNQIKTLLGKWFDAYTIIESEGAWKGDHESSIIIETIFNGEVNRKRVYAIAEEIKRLNKQDAVLITEQEIEVKLV